MTDVTGNDGGSPAAAVGNGTDAAVVAKTRELIETTTLSQLAIGEQLGVPPTTVSLWKRREGWVRPPDAPKPPSFGRTIDGYAVDAPVNRAARRAKRLVTRLYRVYAGQLGALETRLRQRQDGAAEKDARALATLARTLQTLMALERDDGAAPTDPEAVDPDEIRAKLARRLYALGQSGQ